MKRLTVSVVYLYPAPEMLSYCITFSKTFYLLKKKLLLKVRFVSCSVKVDKVVLCALPYWSGGSQTSRWWGQISDREQWALKNRESNLGELLRRGGWREWSRRRRKLKLQRGGLEMTWTLWKPHAEPLIRLVAQMKAEKGRRKKRRGGLLKNSEMMMGICVHMQAFVLLSISKTTWTTAWLLIKTGENKY